VPAHRLILVQGECPEEEPGSAVLRETEFREVRKNFAFPIVRPSLAFDKDAAHP